MKILVALHTTPTTVLRLCADACIQLNRAERPQYMFLLEQPENELIIEHYIWALPTSLCRVCQNWRSWRGNQNCLFPSPPYGSGHRLSYRAHFSEWNGKRQALLKVWKGYNIQPPNQSLMVAQLHKALRDDWLKPWLNGMFITEGSCSENCVGSTHEQSSST